MDTGDHFKPVYLGHHQVHKNQIELLVVYLGQTEFSIGGRVYGIAVLFKDRLSQLEQRDGIFHNQDIAFHCHYITSFLGCRSRPQFFDFGHGCKK